jgi:parvulin-like peptidyl-prolyl isomerase
MGLESDDPVIRRRLVQKLEFLTDDLAARRDPTDADLQAWLDANPETYALAPKVAFRQVFLSPDGRGEALAADAEATLAALAAGTPPEDVGDPILLPGAMPATPLPQIEASFGPEIPGALAAAEPGTWFGPVRSPFGAHLLIVDDRIAGGAPSLDQVRAAVERDWRDAERREARQALYEALRAKYAVTVDDEAVAAAAATQTADAGQ